MTDPQKNSTTSAHDKKSVSEQQDEDYDKMQRENTKYTIPRHAPERPTAQEESDSARASRSRDKKSTDQQTVSQQQRSGAHPPQRLAGALAKAADPVQEGIDQAQQSVDIASAMQHAAATPSLMFHQQQVFHPPSGGFQQQYPLQSNLNAPFSQIPAAYLPPATGTPFGFGGYPLTGGFPPQPSGPCTSTSVPTAPLPWRGGDGDDNIERDSHLVHTLDGCICIHLYIHLRNPEFVCIATAISARASRVNEYILPG